MPFVTTKLSIINVDIDGDGNDDESSMMYNIMSHTYIITSYMYAECRVHCSHIIITIISYAESSTDIQFMINNYLARVNKHSPNNTC